MNRLEFLFLTGSLAAAPAIGSDAGRIDESGYVRIGGIDQWIAIRGSDVRNPAMLYLHGGPGEAQSPFLSAFSPWERTFTVINWDQRGSGKTFARYGTSTPDLTAERLTLDAIEVAEHARKRLSLQKIILVGQSWGTILGMLTVLRRPEIFAAYIGTGQAVNWDLSLKAREAYARHQMLAARDTVALKKLNAVQSLPTTNFKRLSASSKWRWAPSDFQYLDREGAYTGPDPSKAKGDVAAWVTGFDFSATKLWKASTTFDARKLSQDFRLPMYVIQGRDDHIVSNGAAQAWINSLNAPSKGFFLIDGGHFACLTDTAQFLAAMHRCVGR